MRSSIVNIEQLESRTLFSAASLISDVSVSQPHSTTTMSVTTVTGPTLQLTAGKPFSGKLGFYQSGILDPPGAYSATINWGDGSAATKATVSYGTSGTEYGYIFSGAHTFAKSGTYAVKVTLVIGPYNSTLTFPTSLVEYIDDKAIVAPRPNSSGGLTIHPILGKKFTAEIGTFSWPAPGVGLTATINWGDGKTSTGKIAATGVQGIDVIDFKVTGTHTYGKPGDYSIVIKISKGGTGLLTIDSTAKVAV